ncbi:NADH-quinone oxidoreductase subunit C [Zoogloeaceae bacterium G21618-S1]|nr:NADH-quinone oxidoreductase subunit C [Zoogloeaceae bacterium G21618-S1]
MTTKIERLSVLLGEYFGERAKSIVVDRGEVTMEVAAEDYHSVAIELRDRAEFGFEQLIDVSGLDYSTWGNGEWARERYAAATHLLSVANNWRLRLRAFAPENGFPVLDSLCDVWPSANWFEREVFDLFGIMFSGHPDLRRILTDYGFVGHPFRKDFPVSGYVEMRYDPEQRRVVYQPVTIEPRENTPRVVREANYGDVGHG